MSITQSKFYNPKYKNYNATSEVAQDILKLAGMYISQTQRNITDTLVSTALTGFEGGDGTYGERDRYSRPVFSDLYSTNTNVDFMSIEIEYLAKIDLEAQEIKAERIAKNQILKTEKLDKLAIKIAELENQANVEISKRLLECPITPMNGAKNKFKILGTGYQSLEDAQKVQTKYINSGYYSSILKREKKEYLDLQNREVTDYYY